MFSSSIDWSSLLPELLQTIASRLQTLSSYIRFRAVCHSWRAATQLHRHHIPQEFPWLMIPVKSINTNVRWFFNPLTETHHRISLPKSFQNHRCVGSSSDRLVLTDGSPDIVAVNPLTGEMTHLPPLTSLPYVVNFDPCRVGKEYMMHSPEEFYSQYFMREFFLKKVFLSHDCQETKQFQAFAISSMGFNIAYCKHGDASWRSIDDGTQDFILLTIKDVEDAVYFRGKLYLVDNRGSLTVCDVSDHDSPAVEYMSPQREKCAFKHYIVDAMDELVLVSRGLMREGDWDWGKYYVHRFDLNVHEWIPVSSLDDTILFVGGGSAFAIVASQCLGSQVNMIYNAEYCARWAIGMLRDESDETSDESEEDEQVVSSYENCMPF